MTAGPLLCRDCSSFSSSGDCEHPNNIKIDLVTGARKHLDTPSMLREGTWVSGGRCGEQGRWWKAKSGESA